MKKSFLIYSIVGFLATGTITGLLLINRTQGQSSHHNHHSNSLTSEQHCDQGMLNQQQKDQQYIQMMIAHHQGAIDMADLALSKSKRPEIKELALEIKKAQTTEIEQMKKWDQQWYVTEVSNHDNLL